MEIGSLIDLVVHMHTNTFTGHNSVTSGKLALRHDLMVMTRKLNSPSLEASEE